MATRLRGSETVPAGAALAPAGLAAKALAARVLSLAVDAGAPRAATAGVERGASCIMAPTIKGRLSRLASAWARTTPPSEHSSVRASAA